MLNGGSDDGDIVRTWQIRGIYTRGNILIMVCLKCNEEIQTLLFKSYCTGLYSSSRGSTYYKCRSYQNLKVADNTIFIMFMGLGRCNSIFKAQREQ